MSLVVEMSHQTLTLRTSVGRLQARMIFLPHRRVGATLARLLVDSMAIGTILMRAGMMIRTMAGTNDGG